MKEYANAILFASRIGGTLLQSRLDEKAIDTTIKRQTRNAKQRAELRSREVRDVLSAQQVAISFQGRTGATAAMLAGRAIQDAALEAKFEGQETADAIADLKTKATSAMVGRIAEIGAIGLDYYEGEREKQLLKKAG
jgi:hypothetical protein